MADWTGRRLVTESRHSPRAALATHLHILLGLFMQSRCRFFPLRPACLRTYCTTKFGVKRRVSSSHARHVRILKMIPQKGVRLGYPARQVGGSILRTAVSKYSVDKILVLAQVFALTPHQRRSQLPHRIIAMTLGQ